MPPPDTDALQAADDLIGHLQAKTEEHRARLARQLHDEIGGLLVSAVMDVSSFKKRLPALDAQAEALFARVRHTVESAIDVSRRMVEELRPSILDNFGLFAAIKWQLQRARSGSEAVCTEVYPDVEPDFMPHAATALFRIAQEALAMTFNRESVKATDLSVRVEAGLLHLRIVDDGVPDMFEGQEPGAKTALTAMRYRLRALGGSVNLQRTADGGTVLTATVPLSAKTLTATV